jgi:hypothetical protein
MDIVNDKEYARVLTSRKIQKEFTSYICKNVKNKKKKQKCISEFKNILERMMISMANSPNKTSDPVYRNCDLRHVYVKKAIDEMVDKRKFSNLNLTKNIAIDIFNNIIKPHIHDFIITSQFPDTNIKHMIITKDKIIYKNIVMPVTRTILAVLRRYKKQHVLAMMLRYASILVMGQQWGVPPSQYDLLYKKYNVRYEGFASPLNSRLMGKKDAKFCSLFKDTDKHFGSLGPFFNVNMLKPNGIKENPINWTVNPPYVDSILVASAKKVHKTCINADKANIEFMAFFIMPGWEDSECYKILDNSRFKRRKFKFIRDTYFYEYQNKNIIGKFTSYVFILDTYKTTIDYTNICAGMMLK